MPGPTISDSAGADLIDAIPMTELMPPLKDPRALIPKTIPTPSVAQAINPVVTPSRAISQEDAKAYLGKEATGPFVIIIQDRKKKTLHPLLDTRKGPGAMAIFTTREDAINAQSNAGVCKNNWSTILSVI